MRTNVRAVVAMATAVVLLGSPARPDGVEQPDRFSADARPSLLPE
jgi:hypothetical protein